MATVLAAATTAIGNNDNGGGGDARIGGAGVRAAAAIEGEEEAADYGRRRRCIAIGGGGAASSQCGGGGRAAAARLQAEEGCRRGEGEEETAACDIGTAAEEGHSSVGKGRRWGKEEEEEEQATIFRVPDNIRTTSADSFEPKIVSLGPYHHGKLRFRAFDERIKLSYANNFFRRIVGKDANLEQHYSEEISMTRVEFLEMMMLDCVFMAEFLLLQREIKNIHGAEMAEYYDMDPWKWATPLILNDILILENQVPLCLLNKVFLYRQFDGSFPLIQFYEDCFLQIHQNLSPTSTFTAYPNLILGLNRYEISGHLLHLFHSSLVAAPQEIHTVDLPYSFPNAEMLQAMRIQFANKTDGRNFLDITFDENKRSMEIPQLVINDDNISLLRNLVAFEQQCHWVRKYISTYVWFMDCLINTDNDVAVLRKHKIIVSRLRTDEEVAHIFNKLRRTDALIVDDHLYLAEVMNNVESYCRKRTNRIWALWNFSWLRQNYFKNRWVTIGVTAVVFFNLLTLVQTVYAILSYAKQ
ncbi:UPF0481 protein At3g47200-like [Curcuma longa]|uniref:UPF0481 protein At3g47200-like n=1 Tax=Curcuma longa TaxID=136217 RepID=UPI003D9EBCB0